MMEPTAEGGQRRKILAVEDDPAHRELLGLALAAVGEEAEVEMATDGTAALALAEGSLSSLGLILLDLSMPGMDGIEFLIRRAGDEMLRRVPVVVFTASAAPADIERAYEHGANGYVVKPAGFEPLCEAVEAICRYWLDVNTI